MDIMSLVWWLVIGGVVGWLASLLMKTNSQMGILANILVGIVGAAVGSWVAGALGLVATDTLGRILVSVAGAALVILVLRLLKVLR